LQDLIGLALDEDMNFPNVLMRGWKRPVAGNVSRDPRLGSYARLATSRSKTLGRLIGLVFVAQAIAQAYFKVGLGTVVENFDFNFLGGPNIFISFLAIAGLEFGAILILVFFIILIHKKIGQQRINFL
jgi:hypothetical protein